MKTYTILTYPWKYFDDNDKPYYILQIEDESHNCKVMIMSEEEFRCHEKFKYLWYNNLFLIPVDHISLTQYKNPTRVFATKTNFVNWVKNFNLFNIDGEVQLSISKK